MKSLVAFTRKVDSLKTILASMLSWPRVESLKTKLRVDTLGYKFSSELELRLVTILATSLAEVKLMI